MTPTRFAIALAGAIVSVRLLFSVLNAQGNPVSVAWVFPVTGTTVSNTINLEVMASSSAAPIARVEFYDVFTYTNNFNQIVTVTNYITTVTNKFPPPQNLNVY